MLNIENLIHNENNDTFIIDKGEYGTVEVRHYLPGAWQDKFAEAVVSGLTDDGNYHPLRKNACMLLAFMMTFAVDGDQMVVQDGDDVDLYETYRVLEEELGIMTAAREQSASVDAILKRIEENVDLMVFRELERQNAERSAGLSDELKRSFVLFNHALFNLGKAASQLNEFTEKKTAELGDVLTKQNLTQLMESMKNMEFLLTGKI